MQRERKLYLSICDYNKKAVCDLYDNQSDISGQAANVFIDTERNGWKELSFDIPSVCAGENGDEPNYRLNYLIAEYKIKVVTDKETDWFIISEPKIKRNGFSKTTSVRAPHVSQILKNKNMDLEFSDEEGNNVGTAEEILTTILTGTGWSVGEVYEFTEDDGTIKRRSISGAAGTGAYGFIEQLCDAFEAKPIYHGDTQTVDLLPMNPFGKVDVEEIPRRLIDDGNVIELHYDRNVHDLEKTTNTENMVTRLYAYGSSGDLNGACTLQNAEHIEAVFTVSSEADEYCFIDSGETKHFFKGNPSVGDSLIWSDLDLTSKLYIWNDTKKVMYKLSNKPSGSYAMLDEPTYITTKNKFPYVLGLQYYNDVNLLTDEALQEVAAFQRTMPVLYQESEDTAALYIEDEQELSKVGESNSGFLKLGVSKAYGTDYDGAKRIYIDDVLYRTDYDVAERRFFQWHIAKQLKANGDPVSGTASIIFIVHDTNPITWDKVYLKRIYDTTGALIQDGDGNPMDFKYDSAQRPGSVAVWSNSISFAAGDRLYLFCTNSMSGLLGAKQTEAEALVENLQNTTMDGSEKHQTIFSDQNPPASADVNDYGWYYKYYNDLSTPGLLYFCWKSKGDNGWRRVYLEYTPPTVVNGNYFYSLKYKTLWRGVNGQWVKYESAAEQRVANCFIKVFYYCRRRDMLYKGLYEFYTYNANDLPIANYAFPNEFAFYWTFTTDRVVTGPLKLDTIKGYVYQDNDIEHIVTSSVVPFDTVSYPAENELDSITFSEGDINTSTGVEEDSNTRYRSGNLRVWETTVYEYNFPPRTSVIFYNIGLQFISSATLTTSVAATGSFSTPAQARYARFVSSSIPNGYVRVEGYNSKFYINDKPYNILQPLTESGELIGIDTLTEKFADLADKTYAIDLVHLKETQEEIRTRDANITNLLGDMLKDGRWQDSNYVTGDEKRLYDEAYEMLRQISFPEIDYSFTYLDMFGVKNEHNYEQYDIKWPDINITDMAHLVDMESNTNCWAYIDKISKCYDQPWKTTVDIDTKLTLAARHGFTDVIARIAEVAKQVKSKMPEYDDAVTGAVFAARLEGQIDLFNSILKGGSSNWYTDDKGNIIFESSDGLYAMMLSGAGWGISNSKNADGDWEFRTMATGLGITADAIYTGYLNANRIEAGSITTDKISSSFGSDLDISTNKALNLFATVDGRKPAGSLLTGHASESDSYIVIAAKDGDTPAYIAIKSGGKVVVESGSTMHLTSGDSLYIGVNKTLQDAFDEIDTDIENSVVETVRCYKNGPSSTVAPPISQQGGAADATWKLNIEAYSGNNKYLWSVVRTLKKNGIYSYGTPIYEGELGTKVSDIHKEYMRTNSTTPPSGTSTSWSVSIPPPTKDSSGTETNPYVWVCTATTNTHGQMSRTDIHRDTGLESLSGATITATNIASGLSPVPHVESTGISINGNYLKIGAGGNDGEIQILGNSKVYIGTSSSNSAVVLDKNGIAIGSGGSVAIAAQGSLTLASAGRLFIGQSSTLESMFSDVEGEISDVEGDLNDIVTGVTAVKKVNSTGISIDGNVLAVQSTGSVQILGNGSVYIGSSSSNSAVLINKNGIAIGSSGSISLISGSGATGAKITIGTAGNAFTIGSNGTNAYIYNGRTSVSDVSHNGIYLGTDGINVGKASGSHVIAKADGTVDVTGSITATRFTLTGSAMPPSYVSGLTNAGMSFQYAVSNSGTTVPSSGWQNSRPTNVTPGQYVWTKIVTTALNGNVTTEYACEYYSKDGAKGADGSPGKDGKDGKDGTDGKYVSSIVPLYYLHTSKPSKPTTSTTIYSDDRKSAWTTAAPTWASGYTYYRSEKYTYSDSSVVFADVYTDYAMTVANSTATSASTAAAAAASTIEPFTHDGLSYGTTWGGVSYGVVLSNASNAKPMLIGSNSGITIAKSATSGDGAALVIDKSGIALHGSNINFTTTSGSSIVNAVSLSKSGITIASNAKIEIKTGASFTVQSGNFAIDTSGNVSITGTIKATGLQIYNGSSYTNILDNSSKIISSALASDVVTDSNVQGKINANTTVTKMAGISVTNGRIDLSSLSTSVVNDTNVQDKINANTTVTKMAGISVTNGRIDMSSLSTSVANVSNVYSIQSGISIESAGIVISGGKYITVKSGNTAVMQLDANGIDMKTAGKFVLHASDDSSSSIMFGTDPATANFIVGTSGDVVCNSLTVRDMSISGYDLPKVIVSNTVPNEHNVIWIQPTTSTEKRWTATMPRPAINISGGSLGYYLDVTVPYSAGDYVSGSLFYGFKTELRFHTADNATRTVKASVKNGNSWITIGSVSKYINSGTFLVFDLMTSSAQTNIMSTSGGSFTVRLESNATPSHYVISSNSEMIVQNQNSSEFANCEVYYRG